jgi:hypothetical protein
VDDAGHVGLIEPFPLDEPRHALRSVNGRHAYCQGSDAVKIASWASAEPSPFRGFHRKRVSPVSRW